ncbi:MAG: hemolysin III family protein [Actinobacteria bacterium]|nr:hemolysin III family protein [Actinomycetota bacterium]
MHLPLSEISGEAEPEIKPSWRGWIHTGILPLVVIGGVVLLVVAEGLVAKIAAAVFFAGSILLFGTSAIYHRFNWGPKAKLALKRVDHANIFLLIAGSYTPITLLALPKDKGLILIIAIWAVALLGIGFRVFWIGAPRWLYVVIYIAMGWAAVVYLPEFLAANLAMMVLILVGGLLYTLGAVVYALKRPNPFPGHFGFHEIFHSFTVLAFMCHWTAVLLISLSPVAGSFA